MDKYRVPDDKSEELSATLSEKIRRHTCQLFIRGGKHGLKPWGSGVFALINDKHFLLTAAHVLPEERVSELFIILNDGGFVSLLGVLSATGANDDKSIDMAFIAIHASAVEQLSISYDFLPSTKICPRHLLEAGSHYAAFGYPEKNLSKTEYGAAPFPSMTLHNISKPKVYEYFKLNPDMSILLGNTGKGISLANNEKVNNNIRPYGSSGGGIWYMTQVGTLDAPVIDYCLIGIMTEFKVDRYLVIAGCRIEIITDEIDNRMEIINRDLEILSEKLIKLKKGDA
jgi:hypothetical protein